MNSPPPPVYQKTLLAAIDYALEWAQELLIDKPIGKFARLRNENIEYAVTALRPIREDVAGNGPVQPITSGAFTRRMIDTDFGEPEDFVNYVMNVEGAYLRFYCRPKIEELKRDLLSE